MGLYDKIIPNNDNLSEQIDIIQGFLRESRTNLGFMSSGAVKATAKLLHRDEIVKYAIHANVAIEKTGGKLKVKNYKLKGKEPGVVAVSNQRILFTKDVIGDSDNISIYLEDIDSVQTIILRKGFDDRISKVQNIEEANELLDSLLVFSDSRMRCKTQKGFSDIEFHNYFKNVKQLLSQRFNGYEFEQKFDASDWKNRFTELKDIVQITSEEKDKLISEGKKKYKEYKGNFWSNLFGKKEEPVKALNEGVTANVVTQKELAEAFNKSIEVKGVSVKNGNKAKNKKRDINKDDKKSQDVK